MNSDKPLPHSGNQKPDKQEIKNSAPTCGFHVGALCPKCGKGILDYNGMLNLQCPLCGYESGYGFT